MSKRPETGRVSDTSRLSRYDIGPLENELAAYRQRSPQWRDRVQAGDNAPDIRSILQRQHRR